MTLEYRAFSQSCTAGNAAIDQRREKTMFSTMDA